MTEAVGAQAAVVRPDRPEVDLERDWLRLILESRTSELEELCLASANPRDPHVLLIRACCRDLLADPHGAAFLHGQGKRGAVDDFVGCFTDLLLAADAPTKAAIADRAHEALTHSGPDVDYPAALFLLGWAEVRLRRDPARAIGLLRSAASEARLHGRAEIVRLAHSNLAFALTQAGMFAEAEKILDGVAQIGATSDWDRFEGGLTEANRGCIAYWRGDFEEAIVQFDSVIVTDGPVDNFEAMSRVYLAMSLVALNRHDRYYSVSALLQGVSSADKHGIPWDTLRRVASAWLAHAEGRKDLALRIAAPALARTGAPVAYTLLAELYRVLGTPDLSARATAIASSTPLPRYAVVSALVTSAALLSAAAQGSRAHQELDKALEAAGPERILAPFLAEDPIISDLLEAHAHRGSRHQSLLQQILEARERRSGFLGGLLTPREKEVLAGLRTTMTAAEISEHLGISYPTVKTHIRSIYRKLGVTTRRAAVHASLPRLRH